MNWFVFLSLNIQNWGCKHRGFQGPGGDLRVTLTWVRQSELVGCWLDRRVHTWSMKCSLKIKATTKKTWGTWVV